MDLELHPLNRSFEWREAPPPYRRLTPEQVRSYHERGFVLLEAAFDRQEMGRLQAEIDPLEAEVEKFLQLRHDGRLSIARANEISFTVHLVKRSKLLRDFVSGPLFRDIAHDLIGPDVRLYWDQAVYKKPGNPHDFPWHQDNAYTYVDPQQYTTCWVALGDATLENGCPWVLPEQHRRGTLLHQQTELGWDCIGESEPQGAIPVPASAGSVVIFSSLTPHKTGPNTSRGIRRGYVVQIAADGARVVRRGSDPVRPRFDACDDPERQFFILKDGQAPRVDA